MLGQLDNKDKTKVFQLAKIIWDFNTLRQELKKSDYIFVLGSSDLRVAEYAAQLYHQKLASKIIFSGGVMMDLRPKRNMIEAEAFAEVATNLGVPVKDIILEKNAKNTGENILYTYNLLKELDILPKSLILLQKPYMGKRTFATFMKQWPSPDTKIVVSSPNIKMEDYFTAELSFNLVVNTMVGDLQRIIEYPRLGFQIYIEVPQNVVEAMQKLIDLGYNKRLIS